MARTVSNIAGGRSSRILLVLTLLFALAAAVLVFIALNQGGGEEKEKAAATASTTSVVVASRDISARTELTAGMLEVADLPPEQVLRGVFRDTELLVGQVTRHDILANEQITASKIGPQSETEREEGLSFIIPPGKRAFAIQVSEVSAVGGLLLPGDLVDVIGIFDEADVEVDKAVTLLQNIEVLAVAQEAQESIPPPISAEEAADGEEAEEADADDAVATASQVGTRGMRPQDVEPNPAARTVTLAVTLDQAQLLALVQARGELALALRAFGDADEVLLEETDLIPLGARPESR